MDVHEIEIYTETVRIEGTLSLPNPYGFHISVDADDMASISVVTPNSSPTALPLALTSDSWVYAEQDAYPAEALLATSPTFGYGTFTFTFTDLGGTTQTASVVYPDPLGVAPHSGFADVTFPAAGQADVVRNPTLEWTCTGGPCGNFAWYIEVSSLGPGVSYEIDLTDPGATQWAPGLLSAHETYEFWISSGSLLAGSPQALQTSGGDPFAFLAGYETINIIEFATQDWIDAGCALAGVAGEPRLVGSGTLAANSSNQVDLMLAAPNAMAALLIALSSAPVTFKGGTLKPGPLLVGPQVHTLTALGEWSIPFVLPAGAPPGTELWLQWIIQDAAAVHGFSLSNAIRGATP